jgi:hypothetical protein
MTDMNDTTTWVITQEVSIESSAGSGTETLYWCEPFAGFDAWTSLEDAAQAGVTMIRTFASKAGAVGAVREAFGRMPRDYRAVQLATGNTDREGLRLDRLSSEVKGGGGLALPLFFSALLNELLDNGPVENQRLVKVVQDNGGNKTKKLAET